jgi:hypothetical protein
MAEHALFEPVQAIVILAQQYVHSSLEVRQMRHYILAFSLSILLCLALGRILDTLSIHFIQILIIALSEDL